MKYIALTLLLPLSSYAMDHTKDPHYRVYKQRFPQTRKSYKEFTNDHALFLDHVNQEIVEFKKKFPEIFADKVCIFNLGCHDGDTSKSVVEILVKQGAKKISFRAVDPYAEHINETSSKLKNFSFEKIFLEQESLDQYKVQENEKKSAHIILVEQICHHIDNLEPFIEKIRQLAAPESIVLFGHTDDSASFLNQLFSKIMGGTKYININICPQIKNLLKKGNHTFTTKTVTQKINLPEVSKQTWEFLNNIKGNDYQNSYENISETDRKIKNVIEFCATQPLEKLATSWFKKKTFLLALSTQFGKTINLKYKIHTVSFQATQK